jgi:hypothetical protein
LSNQHSLVSVALRTRNGSPYWAEQFASIRAQMHELDEIAVSDALDRVDAHVIVAQNDPLLGSAAIVILSDHNQICVVEPTAPQIARVLRSRGGRNRGLAKRWRWPVFGPVTLSLERVPRVPSRIASLKRPDCAAHRDDRSTERGVANLPQTARHIVARTTNWLSF